MGAFVAAVDGGDVLIGPLAFTGIVFVLLQVLAPLQTAVSQNLGDRTAAWLYDRLTRACVRPPGMGHLEDSRLTGDLTVARDFDLGMTGPPLSYGLDFIAGSMVEMIGGLAGAPPHRDRLLVVGERRRKRQPRSRQARLLRAGRGRPLPHRVGGSELGDRRRRGAGRRGVAPRAGDGARRRVVIRPSSRGWPAGGRDPVSRCDLCLPGWWRPCPRRFRPRYSRRLLACDCRAERRRKDDAPQASVPVVRPSIR